MTVDTLCISAGGALEKVICRHRDITVDTLCISAGGALGKVICRHRDITVDTLCISAGGALEKVISGAAEQVNFRSTHPQKVTLCVIYQIKA